MGLCSAGLALPLPLPPPSLAPAPLRPSGFVLAAARFHRHYGARLYRVPALNLFIGSTSGGATRPPSRPTSAFCPCSGLVALLRANKGATVRLPFRAPPARSARWWRAPPAIAESGLGLATLAPIFVGYRFVLRCAFRAVFPLAFLAGFARPARAPIARWQ